jgi:hypothetical protein
MHRAERIKAAIAVLDEIEKAVSRTMGAPNVSVPLKNEVLRDRIAHVVAIYCATDIANAIGNTGPI